MFKTSCVSLRSLPVLCAGLLCLSVATSGCYEVASESLVMGEDDLPAPRAQHREVDLSAAVTPVEIGKLVPDFTLSDTAGNPHTLSDLLSSGQTVVLEWFNPDCPIARNYHDSSRKAYARESSMAATYAALANTNVTWLAINSGAPGNQGAGLERNLKAIEQYGVPYPVLLDEQGEVGRLYNARTTPHMFIIRPDGTLAYNGAIDDGSTRGPGENNLVAAALANLKAGKPVEAPSNEPFGCSVKYGR